MGKRSPSGGRRGATRGRRELSRDLERVRSKLKAKSYDARAAGRDYRRAFQRYDAAAAFCVTNKANRRCLNRFAVGVKNKAPTHRQCPAVSGQSNCSPRLQRGC